MCLNVSCSKLRIGKHFSDEFPAQNGLKKTSLWYIVTIIIIGLPHRRSSSLLRSGVSVLRVFQKCFVPTVGNGEYGMGLLSRAFEQLGPSSYICSSL